MGKKKIPDRMSKTACVCDELRGLFHYRSGEGLCNAGGRGGSGKVGKRDCKGRRGPVHEGRHKASWRVLFYLEVSEIKGFRQIVV